MDNNIKEVQLHASECVLSPIENSLVLSVLQEGIFQLSLFRAKHQEVDGRFDLRFLRDRASEPYNEPYKPLTRKAVDLWGWKLAWDMSLLHKVFYICHDELSSTRSYSTLCQYIQHIQNVASEEEYFKEIMKNPSKAKGRRTCNRQKQEEEKLEEMKRQQRKLKELREETAYVSQRMKKYYENYYRSRMEQNKLKIELAEEEIRMSLFTVSSDLSEEKKAHSLTMKFLKESLNRLNEKIAYWAEERKKDIIWRNGEIKKLDEEQHAQTTRLQDLFVDYARREKEIEDYKMEREERRKQEEIEEHKKKCAIKIQAWWRGCMVRFNLGPFCPDHLKKKKKKCKKK